MRLPGTIRFLTLILLGGILLPIMMFGCLYACFIEPERFIVRRENVYLSNWHKEHDGLRIMVLSDFHQRKSDIRRFERILRAARREKPDIVVLLGDYIYGRNGAHDQMNPKDFLPELAGISTKFGAFSVLGNHDWYYNGNKIMQILEDAGIPVLENSSIRFNIAGKNFYFYGFPDYSTRGMLIEHTGWHFPQTSDPVIALSHNPDYFYDAPCRAELTLSGHTHGGQVVLPIFGPPILPTRYSFRNPDGWYTDGERKLFVTKGIGSSMIRVRFACVPEIVVLTISGDKGKKSAK